VIDEPEDYALSHWAGVVPLRLTPGLPEPDPGVTAPVPDYLSPGRTPWLTATPMSGQHVILEPLDLSHVDELFAATADPEVWQHLLWTQPVSAEELAGLVLQAQRAHARGERVPWVQRSASTGEVIGTTSYYAVDEVNRSVAIGYTMLGRPWWRTGANTEAKLLLMRRAFDELGAVRVEWHTDLCNERSQRAIERLGAVREGVLHRHKVRSDGTWRDTVLYAMTDLQWPTAQSRLWDLLAAGVPVG